MNPVIWIVGVLFVVAVDGFVRRRYCTAAPARFWLNLWETALVLIGLGAWPFIAAEVTAYLITP